MVAFRARGGVRSRRGLPGLARLTVALEFRVRTGRIAGHHPSSVKMTQKRSIPGTLFAAIAFSVIPTALAGADSAFESADLTALFPLADEPASLAFHAPKDNLPETGRKYRVLNYEGRTVAEGDAASDGVGLMAIHLSLPVGYYDVGFNEAGKGKETGIWVRPRATAPSDEFLGLDAALSWLSRPEDRPALIKNLSHVVGAGGLARERLSWDAIHPAADRWDWETGRKYETTRNLYAEAGVSVLEMFHNAPGWMGLDPKEKYPENLIAAEASWREVSRRWQRFWAALEVWNEPDIGFGGNQPADQYLPLVKTIRHAMRSTGATMPVGGGVFAFLNPGFVDLAARNGLLDEADFISFHYYGDPLGLERVIGQYRDWLVAAGHGTKPLWMTEVGQPYSGKTGVRPAVKVQADTALIQAMQAVEARACGVARFFPFVYAGYAEHDATRHYGMLDYAGSPLRMLAAVAQVGRALSGMEYAGDVPIQAVSDAKRIRVFKPSGTAAGQRSDDVLVVVYSGKVASGAEITLPFPIREAQGIDGRSLPVDQGSRRVPAGDGLVYLRVAPDALAGLVESDTEAMRLYGLGNNAAPPASPVSEIVLQPQIDPASVSAISARGYFLSPDCERFPVGIWINNFSEETRTIALHAHGAPVVEATAGGGERVYVTLDVDVASLPAGMGGDDRLLLIAATSSDGGRIGPVALTLIPSSAADDIAGHLKTSSYQFQLPVGSAYRWDKNANGTVTFGHQPPVIWGYSVTFSGGDRWAYPRFTVPQEVDQAKVTGVLIRARCMNPATVRLMSWDEANVMNVTSFPIIPADGEWHVVYVPLTSYRGFVSTRPGAVPLSRISIGINSRTDENRIEISDLYVIGK